MTIETTLKDIVLAAEALEELKKFQLKGKAGYDASKLLKLCRAELEQYEETRMVSVKAHGVFDEKVGGYTFPTKDAQEKVNAEVKDLLTKAIKLETSKLKQADLEVAGPTVGLYAALDWAIDATATA